MKKTIGFLAAAILTLTASLAQASYISNSSAPALSGATVIDFNNKAVGSYTSFTVGDVTFSGSGPIVVSNQFSGLYNTNGLYLDNNAGYTYTLNFNFSQPVSAFGFNFGASDFGNWILTAYGAGHTLLESHSLPATWSNNGGDFFGIANSGIVSATLTASSYDWVLLDNFKYVAGDSGSSSVPEPSTVILLGAGLAGMALFARKKRQS